jgi:hypothetical protein
MLPFFSRLEKSTRILVAGCGGGFDVFAGVPIAQHLLAIGKSVVFANFSFSNLWLCGGERITPTMWRVDQASNEMPYFPEKWLAEWLSADRRFPSTRLPRAACALSAPRIAGLSTIIRST